jgi:O-antigen/teichoic acid export membrane protein
LTNFFHKLKIIKQEYSLFKLVFENLFLKGISSLGILLFYFTTAKVLELKEYGVFILIYSCMAGISYISRFGLTSVIIKYFSIFFHENDFYNIKYYKKRAYIIVIFMCAILSFIIFLLGALNFNLFFMKINVKIYLIFTLILPFYSLLYIQSSILKSANKIRISFLFEFGNTALITSFIIWVLYFLNFTLSIFYVSNILFFVVFLFFLIQYFILENLINGDKNQMSNFKKYDKIFDYNNLKHFAFLDILRYLINNIPLFILGYFSSGIEIGLFSIAINITTIIPSILWVLNSIYAPIFSRLYNQKEYRNLYIELRKSIIYSTIIGTVIFIFIILNIKNFLLWYKPELINSYNLILIIGLGQLFNVATGPLYFFLIMTNKEKVLNFANTIFSIFFTLFSFFFILKFSVFGAAISTTLILISQNFFYLFFIKKNKNETTLSSIYE